MGRGVASCSAALVHYDICHVRRNAPEAARRVGQAKLDGRVAAPVDS